MRGLAPSLARALWAARFPRAAASPRAFGPVAVCLALAGVLLFPAAPAHAQAKEVASYHIAVRLDADQKSLAGSERIDFLNDTSHPVQELYFHLYPNAFKGPNSTFMKENRLAARHSLADDNWGGMEVSALRLASGYDLLPRSSVDDTVTKVPLPEPLAPGKSLQLEAVFSVKLPRVIARSGYWEGDHFTIGQWFPKLAALTEKGWVAHQYHASSEFFADFGGYRVEITLPDRFVVGASGVPMGEKSNGDGTKTLTFEARSVHDFAWTANPTFREARKRVGDTEIRLLYPAADEEFRERFLSAAGAAVENFGRWFGPYPYPLLTVVDVPSGAGDGMEYPTLVTVSSSGLPLEGTLMEEQVTIHEIGHQWWYGMVATNEFEEAWLDEGFTTYSTRKLVDQLYGEKGSMGNVLGLLVGQVATDRGEYLSIHRLDPVVQDSWRFYSSGSYGGNVYAKVDLILGTLEGYLGPEKMGELLRRYFQRFAFHHPRTEDFLAVVREVAGNQFDHFLQQALYSSAAFDYSVEAPDVGREGSQYRSAVTARRLGDGTMPVEVVTTFRDGQQEREMWDGEGSWQRYQYLRSSPAVKVEVDPEHKLMLDTRWANNSYTSWFNLQPILRRGADLLWLMQGWMKLLGYVI
ncbi:MAG: M1 family metallopeptidase [Chloroflexi bacterium]|nr:M1 family metallopeptidase [Chloroflexota bacterium]